MEGGLTMRKMLAVFVMLALLGGMSVMVDGAAQYRGLVISTSEEDFSDWQWKTDTKTARFQLISTERQAREFVRDLPRYARKPIRDAFADVNFSKDVAIVASLGETSGGYRVEIGQINVNDRSLLVRVGMQSPGQGDFVTMIATHPFDIVTLPREDVPKGDFEFIVFNQHSEAVMDQWMNLSMAQKGVPVRTQRHTVRTGESLWSIASKYKVTVEEIMEWNDLSNHDIWIGQKLLIKS
jgi:hypothetical protein